MPTVIPNPNPVRAKQEPLERIWVRFPEIIPVVSCKLAKRQGGVGGEIFFLSFFWGVSFSINAGADTDKKHL